MKKLLYIVYYYPPVGGSGVQRGIKFTKYLSDYGWQSMVLTPYPSCLKQPKDYSLMKELNPSIQVYRSFTLDARWLFKIFWGLRMPKVVTWMLFHLFIPDAEVLWLPFAMLKIKKIIKKNRPDLVFISGPPFSPFLLGKWIKHRYKIPYVLDFRDDWSQGQSRLDNPPPTAFKEKERTLEHESIKNAAHIVVVIKSYIQDYLRLYSKQSDKKFSFIPNGYDDDDFPVLLQEEENESARLQIAYTGLFYDRRHPGVIFKALDNLVLKGRIDPHKIVLDIYGRNYASFVFKGFETNETIRSIVNLHPYLPHNKVIDVICKADILLLFSGLGEKSDAELPGKLFEYLRTGKPILGLVHPKGASAEVILKANSGIVADHTCIELIEESILSYYHLWEQGELQVYPDWNYIRQFERRQLTSRLAEVFDQVIKNQ